jgi:hypothetical protein
LLNGLGSLLSSVIPLIGSGCVNCAALCSNDIFPFCSSCLCQIAPLCTDCCSQVLPFISEGAGCCIQCISSAGPEICSLCGAVCNPQVCVSLCECGAEIVQHAI